MLVVHQLAGILLDMDALDADTSWPRPPSVDQDLNLALADERMVELADLIALRQIRVEIILPVEARPGIDLRIERHAGAHRLADAFLIGHRKHAGQRGVDKATCVFGSAPNSVAAPEKSLALLGDLGMDLEPDHDLPFAGCALNAEE